LKMERFLGGNTERNFERGKMSLPKKSIWESSHWKAILAIGGVVTFIGAIVGLIYNSLLLSEKVDFWNRLIIPIINFFTSQIPLYAVLLSSLIAIVVFFWRFFKYKSVKDKQIEELNTNNRELTNDNSRMGHDLAGKVFDIARLNAQIKRQQEEADKRNSDTSRMLEKLTNEKRELERQLTEATRENMRQREDIADLQRKIKNLEKPKPKIID